MADKFDPNKRAKEENIKYIELWCSQSKLFWSRLQTATVLHSAVLVGWYKLKEDETEFQVLILCLGIFLSIFIAALMKRDSQYMDEMKQKAGREHFPVVDSSAPDGRGCGYFIVWTFPVAEFFLLVYYYYTP